MADKSFFLRWDWSPVAGLVMYQQDTLVPWTVSILIDRCCGHDCKSVVLESCLERCTYMSVSLFEDIWDRERKRERYYLCITVFNYGCLHHLYCAVFFMKGMVLETYLQWRQDFSSLLSSLPISLHALSSHLSYSRNFSFLIFYFSSYLEQNQSMQLFLSNNAWEHLVASGPQICIVK